MHYVGVDIGSTATKIAVMGLPAEAVTAFAGDEAAAARTAAKDGSLALERTLLAPTGYSSVDAAERALGMLEEAGYPKGSFACVATGYGRIAVPYADKAITEITCHGRGAAYLFGPDGVVVDVGGQDTKVMHLAGGNVKKFVMNDKCAAGTGRFLEIMANRLGVSQEELSRLARAGQPTTISTMCTVFAESEVISLVGKGEPRENIANGIIGSVVKKVAALVGQVSGDAAGSYFLTGGLCDNDYFVAQLGAHLGHEVVTRPQARYAGAIGAAISAAHL
ncbi:MAG: CoA activase [Coriobacteriia bacterium]|nr:CoA activase [Coriobacteriia bacterium]MBS5477200.1 CoA activase [Coriobacteriia bacterium]